MNAHGKIETMYEKTQETTKATRCDEATKGKGTKSISKDKKTKKIEEMKPKKESDRDMYNKLCRLLKDQKRMRWLEKIFDLLYMTKYDNTKKGTERWKYLFLKGYLIPERITKTPDKTMRDYVNKGRNKSARMENKKKYRKKKKS